MAGHLALSFCFIQSRTPHLQSCGGGRPGLSPWGTGACLLSRGRRSKRRGSHSVPRGNFLYPGHPDHPFTPASSYLENEETEAQRGLGPCPQTCSLLVSLYRVTEWPLRNQERLGTWVSRSSDPDKRLALNRLGRQEGGWHRAIPEAPRGPVVATMGSGGPACPEAFACAVPSARLNLPHPQVSA